MLDRIPLYDAALREGLTENIRLNKQLPAFFNDIHENPTVHNVKLNALQTAIVRGDYQAPIFSDEQCAPYLLFLMIEGKIPFWHGMTAYTYLTALAQFTTQQALKPEDEKYKRHEPITVIPLVLQTPSMKELTSMGVAYLEQVCKDFKESVTITLSYAALRNFILQLPSSEQVLIQVTCKVDRDNEIYNLLNPTGRNLPFIAYKLWEEKNNISLFVPSFSLMHHFIHCLSPEPLQIKPMLGQIGNETLIQYHLHDQHPVALYSMLVKSNLTEVHDYTCGPFPTLIHDLGHWLWANLLAPRERYLIFNEIIPRMRTLKVQAESVNDTVTANRISGIIDRLYDFDLTPLSQYREAKSRLATYVARCMRSSSVSHGLFLFSQDEFASIGKCNDDRLYFLICRLCNQLQKEESPFSPLWNQIRDTRKAGRFHRPEKIVCAIESLAGLKDELEYRGNPFLSFQNKIKIEYQAAWHDLLASTTDSKTLWKKIEENWRLEFDFINLVNAYNIKFFEPYLSLIPSEYERLRHIIDSFAPEKSEQHTPDYGQYFQVSF